MVSVKYLHCSMWGSYHVDCEILEKVSEDTYKIKYYDRVLEDHEIEIVPEDRLIFPKHSELIM